MEENFYESSIRHGLDGKILEESGEYDNAVCMQGFAAECALKRILLTGLSENMIRKYNHDIESLLQGLVTMMTGDHKLFSLIDPACGLRLSQLHLSRILFADHPERRYYPDGTYTNTDAQSCRESAEQILNEMFSMYIDGYISN